MNDTPQSGQPLSPNPCFRVSRRHLLNVPPQMLHYTLHRLKRSRLRYAIHQIAHNGLSLAVFLNPFSSADCKRWKRFIAAIAKRFSGVSVPDAGKLI